MRLSSVEGDTEPANVREVSEAFFVELVAAHHSDIVRLAYAMVGEVALAHDVAQTTWTSAWKNRTRLREPAKARRWLLKIGANEARAALRRRRRSLWAPLTREVDDVPATRDVDREGGMDLIAALQRLPARDRQILALRYGLGETSVEIASQVGLSDEECGCAWGRLLRTLRKELEP